MTERLFILAVTIALAWLAIRLWERRRTVTGRLAPGLTVLTSAGCALCVPAIDALRGTGTDAPIRVIDVNEVDVDGIRSVPTVVAVRADGSVALQRSGPSAIRDADRLVASIA